MSDYTKLAFGWFKAIAGSGKPVSPVWMELVKQLDHYEGDPLPSLVVCPICLWPPWCDTIIGCCRCKSLTFKEEIEIWMFGGSTLKLRYNPKLDELYACHFPPEETVTNATRHWWVDNANMILHPDRETIIAETIRLTLTEVMLNS